MTNTHRTGPATLLTMTLLFLALTAFGAAAEPVTVEFWYGDGPQYDDAIYTLVERFNAQRDDIHIEITSRGPSRPWEEQLVAAVVGGTGPDLVWMNPGFISEFAMTQGIFVPLTDIKGGDAIRGFQWLRGTERLMTDGDRWLGVQGRVDARGMYTNQDLLEKAGFPSDGGPETIKDLDEWAAKLTVRSADNAITQVGFAPNGNNWNAGLGWLWVFGEEFYDWEAREPRFTGVPSHKEALEWLLSYVDQYGAETRSTTNGFINETVALHINSTSQLKNFPERNPDLRWNVVPVPHPEGLESITYSSGGGMGIPQGAEQAEAALQFILFMLQPESQVEMYRRARALPPHMDGIRAIAPYVTDPRERVMVDLLPNAYTPVPLLRTVQGHWRTNLEAMRQRQITPEQVLIEMQRALVPAYDEAFGR